MEKKYKYINLKYLNDITSDNDFKRKIFSMFKKEIVIIEDAMKESLKNKDYPKLAELAHKVKSNISILGMVEHTNAMKVLETDIKGNIRPGSYEKRVTDFLNDCHEALKEIEEIENTI